MEKQELKRGRFSDTEKKFIKSNYQFMSDKEIAQALNRGSKSILDQRQALHLAKDSKDRLTSPNKNRVAYLSSLTDDKRREYFAKEIKASSWFKQAKEVLESRELKFYQDKYVEFMMDPTIESMTVAERDALHQMTMAQIRSIRYMKEEKDSPLHKKISRATEIKSCDEVIQKCQESLNTQRKQRVGKQGDQAANFTRMIREMKDPRIRREVGFEAAMLKYIGEKHYNDHLGIDKNIISGQEKKFDIGTMFVGGVSPSGLRSDFFETNEASS